MTRTKNAKTQRSRALIRWIMAAVLSLNCFVVGMGVVTLKQSRDKYTHNAGVQSHNLAQTLVFSLTGMIDSADLSLRVVIDEAQRQQAQGGLRAKEFNDFIARQQARGPMLDSIRMADARGDILYGTAVVPGSVRSVAERSYFRKLREDARAALVISEPVLGLISGKWVVILARRVNGPDGAFAGVAYCAIQLERIGGMLSSIDLGENGHIILRDGDLGTIVRHPMPRNLEAEIGRKPVTDTLRRRILAGEAGGTFFTPRSSDGSARLLSFRKVGEYPLYIIVGLAPDDYLARWKVEVMQVASLVVLFLGMTLVLSRLICQRWLRQLQAEEALQCAKEELESRVALRTEELSRANERLKSELAERELAEEKLRLNRNMLAQIIDTIPQFVFWKDRASIYQGCNTAFARGAGVARPENIVGKSDFDLPWLPEESEAYRSDDRAVMDGDTPKFHIIEQQRQAEGVRCWVDTTKVPLHDDGGEVIGVLGVYEDISARKAVEESRNKALALVESLLASSPTGILVYDGETGNCVLANEAVAQMVGATVDELLAQNFRKLESWQISGIAHVAEQVLATSETRKMEVTHTSTFGREIVADCFFSRFEVDGHPHLMFIVVDTAEKKRLEREHKLIEAQMLHVQKLESLGVLAGGIAHDFNNILMVVLGNADLAQIRLPAESPAKENLVQIEQAATRAADLARQMLAYSGRGNFVIENLDLTKIVEEMAQMLEVSISKKVLLRYDFAPGLPPISGDATQLRQVILNLVINASEAIGDENGVITVCTRYMECDRAYLSESWIDDKLPEGPYLVLEVSDTGCGIERDIIPKIFDPFFTTKFTGRGLGMAAVLGIVRAHKGAIKIYSEKGKGSTFRLLLPCTEGVVRQRELFDEDLSWRGSGTVLLADDEQSIRVLGQDMLESLGFRVLTACDGVEAVEIFKEHMGEVAVVLLDLTMPRMDGERTFRALRILKPDLKVIMSSGYNEQEVGCKFVGSGLSGFIQKPYKLVEVSRKLQEVLGG